MVCYLMTLFFASCHTTPSKDVDVSKVHVKLRSIRFDQELFACDTNQLESSIDALGNKYPDFSSIYFNQITGFNKNNRKIDFLEAVHHFLTYKDYKGLADTVNQVFPDVKKIDKQLEDLFKHVKYYYPTAKVGDVYYFISGLNYWSAITVDTAVGVGLDMYLGKDYPNYAAVQIPAYQVATCEQKYIPVNVSKALYEDKYPFNPDGKTLLDLMIMKGKEMLYVEYMLPNAPDELLMGYTKAQLDWCQKNEGFIWNYFAQQKLLYNTHWQDIMRYVNEGPNSTGMPPESPGNIGTWIGWQLVRKYNQEHADQAWTKMIEQTMDGQSFLRAAAYKPH